MFQQIPVGPLQGKRGTYQAVKFIGAGTSANLFSAKCLDNNRKVVIKIYKSRILPPEEDFIQRLISNPNQFSKLIEHFDFFIDQRGQTCAVLEFADGGDLYELNQNQLWLSQSHQEKATATLEIIYQVAEGLQQLHESNMTHRDVKPENILLINKYNSAVKTQVKLADFGLVNQSDNLKTHNIGTRNYSPQEIYQSETYSNKVDVWALACVWYFLETGHDLFDGVGPSIYKQDSINQKVSSINSDQRNKSLMMKALQVQERDRITIREFKNEINQLINPAVLRIQEVKANIVELGGPNAINQQADAKNSFEGDEKFLEVKFENQLNLLQNIDKKVSKMMSIDHQKLNNELKQQFSLLKDELTELIIKQIKASSEIVVSKVCCDKNTIQLGIEKLLKLKEQNEAIPQTIPQQSKNDQQMQNINKMVDSFSKLQAELKSQISQSIEKSTQNIQNIPAWLSELWNSFIEQQQAAKQLEQKSGNQFISLELRNCLKELQNTVQNLKLSANQQIQGGKEQKDAIHDLKVSIQSLSEQQSTTAEMLLEIKANQQALTNRIQSAVEEQSKSHNQSFKLEIEKCFEEQFQKFSQSSFHKVIQVFQSQNQVQLEKFFDEKLSTKLNENVTELKNEVKNCQHEFTSTVSSKIDEARKECCRALSVQIQSLQEAIRISEVNLALIDKEQFFKLASEQNLAFQQNLISQIEKMVQPQQAFDETQKMLQMFISEKRACRELAEQIQIQFFKWEEQFSKFQIQFSRANETLAQICEQSQILLSGGLMEGIGEQFSSSKFIEKFLQKMNNQSKSQVQHQGINPEHNINQTDLTSNFIQNEFHQQLDPIQNLLNNILQATKQIQEKLSINQAFVSQNHQFNGVGAYQPALTKINEKSVYTNQQLGHPQINGYFSFYHHESNQSLRNRSQCRGQQRAIFHSPQIVRHQIQHQDSYFPKKT